MNAVWMRARNELRTRWRALLSLALIAGLGGGAAIAAFAGARRTISAYPRFRATTNAFDILIGVNSNGPSSPDLVQTALLRSIEHLPAIEDFSFADPYLGELIGPSGVADSFPDIFVIASPDGRIGITLNQVKLKSGGYADPTRPDEAIVSSIEAQKLGARVGSTLTFKLPDATRTLHVVGVGIVAGAIDPAAAAYTPVVILTPAFYAQNGADERVGPAVAARVRGGTAGIPELQRELASANDARIAAAKDKAAAEYNSIGTTALAAPQTDSVRRTALFEAVGLLVFGGLALVTVLAIFGQLLARQIFLETGEQDALRALGMSRNQLFVLSFARVALVGVGAIVVSVALAIAASGLFPFGFMNQLEVSPGVAVDWFAIGLGVLGIFVLILLTGIVPAFQASAVQAKRVGGVGTNRTANALAAASFPPTAVAGVRMALEPGHGSTAVPVRTTIFGTILALAALLASLSFGASLQHLVATPSLSGWNFDVIVPGSGDPQEASEIRQTREVLQSSPLVDSFTLGTFPNFEIKGISMSGFAFAPGPFGPSIASGRAPQASDEIALSTKTLRALHTSVGKTVPVTLEDPTTNKPATKPVPMRIVGAAVTPQFFFTQFSSNYSGVVTQAFIDSLHLVGAAPGGDTFFIRFRSGLSVDSALARLRSSLPSAAQAFILKRASTSDLGNLNRIANLPSILAALLALVAAGTLAHTLITSVRRRRRDLAILRALGFVRRQVAMTVAWQATTIAFISLAIGLPLGAILGRLAWGLFVNQLGYVPVTIVPPLGIILAIPVVFGLGILIASIPARAAARTEPAVVLRAE